METSTTTEKTHINRVHDRANFDITEMIKEIVEKHPETRNDNRLLLFHIYSLYGLNLTPEQWEKVKNLPQPETIRRNSEKIRGLKKKINEVFKEIDRLDDRIKANQAESDRLKVETQTILKEFRTAI